MSKIAKILIKILSGQADSNINFEDLRRLLLYLGFDERIKGSHHIYFKLGIDEILKLQPKGNNAKSYQVKQVRLLILKYKLTVQ